MCVILEDIFVVERTFKEHFFASHSDTPLQEPQKMGSFLPRNGPVSLCVPQFHNILPYIGCKSPNFPGSPPILAHTQRDVCAKSGREP